MDNISTVKSEKAYDPKVMMQQIAGWIEANNISTYDIMGYKMVYTKLRINWADAHQIIRFKWVDQGHTIRMEKGEMIKHDMLEEVIRYKRRSDSLDELK